MIGELFSIVLGYTSLAESYMEVFVPMIGELFSIITMKKKIAKLLNV